ncbi:uncharacterized protein METZ01_LOCUS304358, partial [marine metagenome]
EYNNEYVCRYNYSSHNDLDMD